MAAGLPEASLSKLSLLAEYHDIGMVGIDNQIVIKPEKLTPEEAAQIRRHCEIGYRIAQISPDLMPIADLILKHHEWWNGGGYPLGLHGDQIPVECRIMAIADAYDAMTSHRPYRKPLQHGEALKELQRCSESQFDPYFVELFIGFPQPVISN